MIMNNSNTKTYLLLLTFFIFSCGSDSANNVNDSANNANDSAQIDIADETQEEPLTNSTNAVSYTHLTLPTTCCV